VQHRQQQRVPAGTALVCDPDRYWTKAPQPAVTMTIMSLRCDGAAGDGGAEARGEFGAGVDRVGGEVAAVDGRQDAPDPTEVSLRAVEPRCPRRVDQPGRPSIRGRPSQPP
jgi:hypothetical protein